METIPASQIIFVHGVGYFSKGRLPKDSTILIKDLPYSKVDDFCWSELVEHPLDYEGVKLAYLTRLGKALHNSAWLGFEVKSEYSLPKKITLFVSNITTSIIYFLLLIYPIILFFYIGGKITTPYYENVDPTWEYAIQKKPFYLSVTEFLFGPHYLMHFYEDLLLYCLYLGLGSIFLSIFFSQLTFGFLNGLKSAIRRIVIMLIWPIVFFLVALSTYNLGTLILVTIFFVGGVFSQFSLVYADIHQDYSFASTLLLVPALFLVAVLLLKLISKKFGVQLKLLGDIFFYLGEVKYREALQEKFKKFMASYLGHTDQEIVFITHSLGTVIASDFLLQNPTIKNPIYFITMGSPLKRLFYNFFPSFILSPAEKAVLISTDYSKFKWINIYRPLDVIGGKLSKRKFYLIQDISTKQYKDPLSSHVGYWRDEKVSEIIKEYYTKTFLELGPAVKKKIIYRSYPTTYWSNKLLSKVGLGVLLFAYPFWISIISKNHFEPQYFKHIIAERYTDLERNGQMSTAIVYPFKITNRVNDGNTTRFQSHYKVKLVFENQAGEKVEKEFVDKLLINMKIFAKDFTNGQAVYDTYERKAKRYDRFETPIIYHIDDNDKFMLPNYKTDKQVSDGLDPIMDFLAPILSPVLSLLVMIFVFGNLIFSYAGFEGNLIGDILDSFDIY